jgi:hypothetical protein
MGFFGLVWKAKVIEGPFVGTFVALKKINLDKYADEKLEDIKVSLFFSTSNFPSFVSPFFFFGFEIFC